MDTLFMYDDTEGIWTEEMQESLTELCEGLIAKYDTIAKFGFFGAWDGPRFGGSLITDADMLRGHITQDFTVQMSWDLSYAQSKEDVKEIQRYCGSTDMEVPAGSLVLRQWHHDGCNCYVLRPIREGANYGGRAGFIDWCKKHTKKVDLKGII